MLTTKGSNQFTLNSSLIYIFFFLIDSCLIILYSLYLWFNQEQVNNQKPWFNSKNSTLYRNGCRIHATLRKFLYIIFRNLRKIKDLLFLQGNVFFNHNEYLPTHFLHFIPCKSTGFSGLLGESHSLADVNAQKLYSGLGGIH